MVTRFIKTADFFGDRSLRWDVMFTEYNPNFSLKPEMDKKNIFHVEQNLL